MRNPRSGFALLFVYAMAATIAIMLYMSMPRIAFEAQRDKEQLLIDRGEQYSRAINLFVRKFNRYPADFDALKSTQNLRFLRKEYVDPFTGKSEWRLVHVGPGGVFIDSLVYNKKKDDANKTEQQTFITEMQQVGGNPVDPNSSGNMANQANRDAVRTGLVGQDVNLVPGQQQPPGGQPGAPQQFDANGQPIPPPQPGAPPSPAYNPFPAALSANGQTAQTGVPGSPQAPLTLPPGVQFPPGVQQPGQQQQPNGPPTSAANLINQLLTSPRVGGFNGLGGPQNVATAAGGTNPASTTSAPATTATLQPPTQTIGGGIAGIASKVEQEGIKTYKEKTKYNLWEFVYDITKDPTRTALLPQPAANANTGAAPGTPGAPNTGTATSTSTPTTPTANPGMATPPPPSPPAAMPTQ